MLAHISLTLSQQSQARANAPNVILTSSLGLVDLDGESFTVPLPHARPIRYSFPFWEVHAITSVHPKKGLCHTVLCIFAQELYSHASVYSPWPPNP